jgi:hypothetical protein
MVAAVRDCSIAIEGTVVFQALTQREADHFADAYGGG